MINGGLVKLVGGGRCVLHVISVCVCESDMCDDRYILYLSWLMNWGAYISYRKKREERKKKERKEKEKREKKRKRKEIQKRGVCACSWGELMFWWFIFIAFSMYMCVA